MLAGGGRVCVVTFGSWSYLRERLCSQSRVCVPTRGTTTRSRSPLSSQELTLAACLAIGDLIVGGGTQEDMSGNRASLRSASELRGCECEMLRGMLLSEESEQQRVFRMVPSASE